MVLSAFFSASETAYTTASRPFVRREGKGKRKQSALQRALWLFDHNQEVVVTILLGNNAVNIVASSLATASMVKLFGDAGIIIASIGVTIIVFFSWRGYSKNLCPKSQQ